MGQSQSSIERQKKIEELKKFSPPIQTRDELLQRYAKKQARVQDEYQGRWFDQVFDIFCTQTESAKFWSEQNLADFMQGIFPSELTPILTDAIPIMHRCLLRLGSYPYQNDPEKLLTHDVLRTAFNEIYRLYGHTDYGDPFPNRTKMIAFQCLASLGSRKPRNEEHRSEEDDYDLKSVLDGFRARRRDPDYPKQVYIGPSNPPPSHFPSSWSGDLDQTIPTGEFRSFLRLMMVLNLYNSGIDTAHFSACLTQVEKTTDCLLAAFQPSLNHGMLSWENFSHAATYDVPYFFLGTMRLLGPLVCPRILPRGSLPASVTETQDFFREAYVPSIQCEVPSPGYILNLPLLSQLGLMLPRWILYEGMSVACSATIDQINLRDLKDHITRDPPMLLLVSGRSNNNQYVTFGLFYPKGFLPDGYNEELEARMFQFEPVQRYFGTHNSKDYSIQFDLEGENPTMTGQVTWQTKVLLKEESNTASTDRFIVKDDVMNLTVSSKGLGHFMVQAHRFPRIDEYFDVDAVELVKCDNQRIFVADYEYDECYYYLDDD